MLQKLSQETGDNSLHNEEDRCVEEEEVLDVDDLYDATEDQFLASLEQFQ